MEKKKEIGKKEKRWRDSNTISTWYCVFSLTKVTLIRKAPDGFFNNSPNVAHKHSRDVVHDGQAAFVTFASDQKICLHCTTLNPTHYWFHLLKRTVKKVPFFPNKACNHYITSILHYIKCLVFLVILHQHTASCISCVRDLSLITTANTTALKTTILWRMCI